jgi:hypothetical protein
MGVPHAGWAFGWPVPAWTREPQREALPWWFVTELRGLHPRALVESPSSFRRRGVFITRGALEREVGCSPTVVQAALRIARGETH